jgi:hypothetical protein
MGANYYLYIPYMGIEAVFLILDIYVYDINTCSDEIDSNMVYCAAFGCNNQAKKGNGQVFFSFPKDSNLQKCGHITARDGTSHRY